MRASSLLVAAVFSACGSPSSTPDGGAEFACDSMTPEVTLAGQAQPQVFDTKCRSCHNAASAANGDYSQAAKTAEAVARTSQFSNELKVVEPRDLSRSVMWLKLNGRRGPKGESLGGVMPPAGMLDAATLKIVKDWICSGAK